MKSMKTLAIYLRDARLIYWLRLRLYLRMFRRNPSILAGFVLSLVGVIPGSVWLFIWLLITLLHVPAQFASAFLMGILLFFYSLWFLSGFLNLEMEESLDITKLLVYPLSLRRLFIATWLTSPIELPFLHAVFIYAPILIAFSHSVASFLVALLSLIIFHFHAVCLFKFASQLNLAIIRNRLANLALVLLILFVLASALYVVAQNLPSKTSAHEGSLLETFRPLFDSQFWKLLGFLPPGLISKSIVSASQGNFAVPAINLFIVLLLTGVIVILAGAIMERVYLRAVITGEIKPRESLRKRARSASSFPGLTKLPLLLRNPAISAVVEKELKSYIREPALLSFIASPLLLPAIIGISFILAGKELQAILPRDITFLILTALVSFTWAGISVNIFGIEKAGVHHLLLSSASRRAIFLGKNLVLCVSATILNFIVFAVLGLMFRNLSDAVLGFLTTEASLPATLGAGNTVSVLFPVPIGMREWRPLPRSFTRGVAYTFLLAVVQAMALLMIAPVFILIWLPSLLGKPAFLLVTLPSAILYSSFIYLGLLPASESLMLKLEERLINALRPYD